MDAIDLDGNLSLKSIRYTDASPSECDAYRLAPGDFLFNTRNSRELVGKTALYDGLPGVVYNNNIMRVRFTDAVTPEYMLRYFRSKLAVRELDNRKAGTTSVFAIYQKSLADLPVVVPPRDHQDEFSSRATRIRQSRSEMKASLEVVEALFTSLQSRAFTGQL